LSSGTRAAHASIMVFVFAGVPVPIVSPTDTSWQPMSYSAPATRATAEGAISPS
jgi:hypothetical protein